MQGAFSVGSPYATNQLSRAPIAAREAEEHNILETFTVPVEISSPQNGPSETVNALVGGGASVAVMPSSLLNRLGIEPERTMHFRGDDGGRVELPVGHAFFSVEGAEGEALVVFGPEDRCEIGTDTLSALLLEPDPTAQTLFPVMGLGLLPGIFLLGDGPFD